MAVVCAGKSISEKERIKILMEDGEYEGVVRSAKNDKLVLQQVKSLTTNISYNGLQIFLVSEIVRAEILESSIKESSSCDEIKTNDPNSRNGSNTKRFFLSLKENEKMKSNALLESESQIVDNDGVAYLVTINALNQSFHDAIKYIKLNRIIGVAAEGINVEQNGDLCLLQIDTEKTVFLFDMVELGEEFFQNGLAEIMTSQNILKIFHNCRELSGFLALYYRIKLQNVFDTQVADVIIFKSKGRYFPKFVCSLPNCLINVLGLDKDDVNCITIREGQEKEDLLVWRQRPLPLRFVDAAVKDVVHLRRLRTALLEELQSEIIRGTEIYLNAYKNMRGSYQEHLLPTQFANLANVQEMPRRLQSEDNMLKFDESGFLLNKIKNHDWRMRFYRDACHMDRIADIPDFNKEDIAGVIKTAKDLDLETKSQNRRPQNAGRNQGRNKSRKSNRTSSCNVSGSNLEVESGNNDTKNSQKSVEEEGENLSDQRNNSKRRSDGNRGQSDVNQKQSDGNRRQSEGNRGQSDGDQAQSDVNRRQSGGNRRQSEGNRGQSDGNQGQSDVNRRQSGGNRGRSDGNRGRFDGNRGRFDGNRGQSDGDRGQSGVYRRQSGGDRRRFVPVPSFPEVTPVKERTIWGNTQESQYSSFRREITLKDRYGVSVKLG